MSVVLSSSLLAAFSLLALSAFAQSPLTIAAASDLTDLEPALQGSFGKIHPGRLRFVTEASALLAQQIENGAPYDVFLSANAAFVDRLASNGKLLPGSVRAYAVGRIGLLWKDGKQHDFRDLAAPWVRFVALPNPELAPYGVAARQAIQHEGLWPQVQPKIVYGENVRQTLELFDSGNADAVLTSDALLQGRGAQLVPTAWHQPIVQKAGVVAGCANRAGAEEFMRFLLSSSGQAIFAQFGFGPPPH